MNCPLVSGLRPCMCDLPRCPVCGYTEHDARFEMDHIYCQGEIPPARSSSEASQPSEPPAPGWTYCHPSPEDLRAAILRGLSAEEQPGITSDLLDGLVREVEALLVAKQSPGNGPNRAEDGWTYCHQEQPSRSSYCEVSKAVDFGSGTEAGRDEEYWNAETRQWTDPRVFAWRPAAAAPLTQEALEYLRSQDPQKGTQ